ncbi:MAG: hypothetical protein R3A13_05845 [Bdellovibrionota bacterium]
MCRESAIKFCTQSCEEQELEIRAEARITIYTEVREDSIKLYGFHDTLEKEVFLLLAKVKGVAAKSALEIVSLIENENCYERLPKVMFKSASVKGLVKKLLKDVLELKDRVAEYVDIGPSFQGSRPQILVVRYVREAVQALQALKVLATGGG